jgi:2-C-methyl-D-erythritol 2,4-cyclodiphosphate synthase
VIEEHDHEYRTGIGTDIHEVASGRKLMLGGVYIEHPKGLAGHSDGDVVLHAVVDALLGAAGMGDIGTLFPDTDPNWKDADSKEFLQTAKELLEDKRWIVVNVDLIIHTEQPRLEPYKKQIKRCIASLLGIDFEAVNVKAKTNEGFGDIGTGDAIASTAIVLIRRKYRRTL